MARLNPRQVGVVPREQIEISLEVPVESHCLGVGGDKQWEPEEPLTLPFEDSVSAGLGFVFLWWVSCHEALAKPC